MANDEYDVRFNIVSLSTPLFSQAYEIFLFLVSIQRYNPRKNQPPIP